MKTKKLNKKYSSICVKKAGKIAFKKTDAHEPLVPIFKWTGGKRREIKSFEKYFPSFVGRDKDYTFVEPFVGGGAVYFHLNNVKGKNIINDFDFQVANFYKQFALGERKFISQLKKAGEIEDHDTLEALYYELRNKDKNNGLKNVSELEQAIRFFVVNQLAFSGMRRFNASGEFNVPFGHYKGLNSDVVESIEHRALLTKTDILTGDFEPVMKDNDKNNTFIFLDPPYTRVFKEYSADNSFGEEDHLRLAKTIKEAKNSSIMMVIDKSDFTKDLYKDLIVDEYSLKYGVNIKNRFKTDVKHLIICNY